MPALVWLLLLAGAGAAVALKKTPGPFAGWQKVDRGSWGAAAELLASTLAVTGQNALMSPDGKLMAVRNGETVEVYAREA